jgi:hypothetical protein
MKFTAGGLLRPQFDESKHRIGQKMSGESIQSPIFEWLVAGNSV